MKGHACNWMLKWLLIFMLLLLSYACKLSNKYRPIDLLTCNNGTIFVHVCADHLKQRLFFANPWIAVISEHSKKIFYLYFQAFELYVNNETETSNIPRVQIMDQCHGLMESWWQRCIIGLCPNNYCVKHAGQPRHARNAILNLEN